MNTFEKTINEVTNTLFKAKDNLKPMIAKDLIQALATNYLSSDDIEELVMDLVSLEKVKIETEQDQAEADEQDDRDYEQAKGV